MDEGSAPRKTGKVSPSVVPLDNHRKDRVTAFSEIGSKYAQEVI